MNTSPRYLENPLEFVAAVHRELNVTHSKPRSHRSHSRVHNWPRPSEIVEHRVELLGVDLCGAVLRILKRLSSLCEDLQQSAAWFFMNHDDRHNIRVKHRMFRENLDELKSRLPALNREIS